MSRGAGLAAMLRGRQVVVLGIPSNATFRFLSGGKWESEREEGIEYEAESLF